MILVINWLAELHMALDKQDIKSLQQLLISIGMDTKEIKSYLKGLTICRDSKVILMSFDVIFMYQSSICFLLWKNLSR